MCLKKIREEHENEEDHYMECSTSDKDKQLQQATSTETEGSYLSEAREPPSITVTEDTISTQTSCENTESTCSLSQTSCESSMEFIFSLEEIINSNQSFTYSHDMQHLNEYLKIIGERNLR
eukprot:XP_011424082.2 PREDICTED: uncharacterized protein LOC105325963 [Crassostrea gigas]